MKRILNTLALPVILPFSLLRKTRIDNFVGGLIFGALFSLVVNIITVQIQETIQKQRVLEALENEILFNLMQANSIAIDTKKKINNNELPNMFYGIRPYPSNIWLSSETLQYVAQLDPSIQSKIFGYYNVTLPMNNVTLDKLNDERSEKLSRCFVIEKALSKSDQEICIIFNSSLNKVENDIAMDTSFKSAEVLKVFHPTKDRLQDPILSFLIGNKSTRVLSGK